MKTAVRIEGLRRSSLKSVNPSCAQRELGEGPPSLRSDRRHSLAPNGSWVIHRQSFESTGIGWW
jgi:hypothetical protein